MVNVLLRAIFHTTSGSKGIFGMGQQVAVVYEKTLTMEFPPTPELGFNFTNDHLENPIIACNIDRVFYDVAANQYVGILSTPHTAYYQELSNTLESHGFTRTRINPL